MEILILLSNNIRLNTDILETNVIIITILVVILFNVVGGALKESMLERKEKILNGVQEAEQRLQEASERLLEVKAQLDQSELIFDKIEADSQSVIETLALYNEKRVSEGLERQVSAGRSTIKYKQQHIIREIKDNVALEALNIALKFCRDQMKMDKLVELLDQTIENIGGQQWQAKF